jgi:hypothetical protein
MTGPLGSLNDTPIAWIGSPPSGLVLLPVETSSPGAAVPQPSRSVQGADRLVPSGQVIVRVCPAPDPDRRASLCARRVCHESAPLGARVVPVPACALLKGFPRLSFLKGPSHGCPSTLLCALAIDRRAGLPRLFGLGSPEAHRQREFT